MKLIIDIPELDYECAKQRLMKGIAFKMDYYISKGIPLDDVKAENKGEWIEKEIDGYIRYYCSKCGNCVSSFMNCSDFCPNCGADMRKPKDQAESEE